MTDLLYLGTAAAFFVLTWGLLRACDRLMTRHDGEGEKI